MSQEALTNIGKHAEARQVFFSATVNEKCVSLVIGDDGKGFDVNRVRAGSSLEKGMGLDAMAERAHMLGASLDVRSKTGEGTRINLTIPIQEVGNE